MHKLLCISEGTMPMYMVLLINGEKSKIITAHRNLENEIKNCLYSAYKLTKITNKPEEIQIQKSTPPLKVEYDFFEIYEKEIDQDNETKPQELDESQLEVNLFELYQKKGGYFTSGQYLIALKKIDNPNTNNNSHFNGI